MTLDHQGQKRVEFGRVIYTDSAEKAARFIMDCNQNIVPLLFLHDVNGFMVGKEAENSGIIRALQMQVHPPTGFIAVTQPGESGTFVPGGTYVAQRGDTLWVVARALKPTGDVTPTMRRLIELNGGPSLEVGQVVVLPG